MGGGNVLAFLPGAHAEPGARPRRGVQRLAAVAVPRFHSIAVSCAHALRDTAAGW
jgi:hypothetical protein